VPYLGSGLMLLSAYSAFRHCDFDAAAEYLAPVVMGMIVGVFAGVLGGAAGIAAKRLFGGAKKLDKAAAQDAVRGEEKALASGPGAKLARPWSKSARMRAAGLPFRGGSIRYVPPEDWHPSTPLPRGPNKGYRDRFGNEWKPGPSRTEGDPFEWDVVLSRQGRASIGWLSIDGKHVNVSLGGWVTH
jgi:filamentous hemagglutinin